MDSTVISKQLSDQAKSATIAEGSAAQEKEPALPNAGENRTCAKVKADGNRCGARALNGAEFCFFHDPASVQERAAASRRGGEKNRARVLPSDTSDFPLSGAGDAAALLGRTVNQVLRGELDPRVANTVGYLIGLQIRALDAGKLEERLAGLEALMKQQQTPRRRF
jgi:hypothetical protein